MRSNPFPVSDAPADWLRRARKSLRTLALLICLSLQLKAGDKPWQEMDYGPFLTASIEVPGPVTNIAYKGIAVHLAEPFGGTANEAIVFDTDLLRYAAGWTGDFVALKGVVFDGEHWAYPRIEGSQVFHNLPQPGWSTASSFRDPRSLPFGPLPRAQAHWRGLYLQGKRVVFSYEVGGCPILEMPSLERRGDLTAFVRQLNLGARSETHRLQLAYEAAGQVRVLTTADLREAGGSSRTTGATLATLAMRGSDELLAIGLAGDATGAEWLTDEPGHVRLLLAPTSQPSRIKILIWRGPRQRLADFAAMIRSTSPAEPLEAYTKGGPPRWPQTLSTRGVRGSDDSAYTIDTLTAPEDNPWKSWLRFGGLDFFSDARRAAICTWNGDVWQVDNIEGDLQQLTWRRIATGLFQPLGLKIVKDQIYVLGRDQITRLHDLNGDGEADFYENFNNDCMVSEHFHEFATDLKTDADGNFYYIKCARHALPAVHAHHGTLLKVTPDGAKLEVVARGFRAVNGLGISPRGEITCVDNQGHWMPGNRINWIKPGGWYGNQWAWNPDHRTQYDEPLCWMHNFVDRSGGTHVWVPTDQWGPLRDQCITLSYGMGHMLLLLHEEVDGVRQGGVTRFPLEFETGVMRGVFHPQNHQLYACGLYGWAGNKTKPGGFYRIRHTGKPVYLPTSLNVARDGLLVGFSAALDPNSAVDPGNYDVQLWNYRWTEQYGSPDFRPNGQEGRERLVIKSVSLSADRQRVFLELPGIQTVMQAHLAFKIRAADGTLIDNFVHHTIHRLGTRPGRECLGDGPIVTSSTREIVVADQADGLVQQLADGENRTDIRRVRLPALFVRAGQPASMLLSGKGPLHSRWSGYLKLDLNQRAAFRFEGKGSARLRINDRNVLSRTDVDAGPQPGLPVDLRGGLNAFELEYDAPANGEAELRLFWSAPDRPWEPVPPAAFVHDARTPGLAESLELRQGRHLFALYRCAQCHRPESSWPAGSMPELDASLISLDEVGDRLNGRWLSGYLEDPSASREDVLMPRVHSGDAGGTRQDAADIAAFLSSLRATAGQANEPMPAVDSASEADLKRGRTLYQTLGCLACHRLAGEAALTNDNRIALAHVPRKWKAEALPSFLQQPDRFDRWTRMPNFKLSPDESIALAKWLFNQTVSESGPPDQPAGDALKGRTLVTTSGCLACHSVTGLTNQSSAPSLSRLRRGNPARGCLADQAAERGQAAEFRLTSGQRAALRSFLRQDAWALLQRDTPDEFLPRYYETLRCSGCHARDQQTDLWSALPPVTGGGNQSADESEDSGAGGTVHLGRPALTFAGEKLQADWMTRFLTGQLPYKPRPESQGRMPAFKPHANWLAEGMAMEHGISPAPTPRPQVDQSLAQIGQALTVVGDGFGCVACHNVGKQKALAGADTATINFAFVADRLRSEYFWRYLRDPQRFRPGTMMPSFMAEDGSTPIKAVFDGDATRQFAAIWQYLLSLTPEMAAEK